MTFNSYLEKVADTLIQHNEFYELILVIQIILSPEISYQEEKLSKVHLSFENKEKIIQNSNEISDIERSRVANDLYIYSVKYSGHIKNIEIKNNLQKFGESMKKISIIRR